MQRGYCENLVENDDCKFVMACIFVSLCSHKADRLVGTQTQMIIYNSVRIKYRELQEFIGGRPLTWNLKISQRYPGEEIERECISWEGKCKQAKRYEKTWLSSVAEESLQVVQSVCECERCRWEGAVRREFGQEVGGQLKHVLSQWFTRCGPWTSRDQRHAPRTLSEMQT